ncbi:MAG: PIG-L deacetylase family protein [Planctomycetota bacterium]
MARLLAVTAHPDDECFVFGGALAHYARRGHAVGLLCLTDGQAGRTGGLAEREKMGAVRREELHRACGVLGIPTVMTPGLMDGALEALGESEGAAIVADAVREFDADVLLTFGPEGASGHADHKAAWRWTRAAAGGRRLYAASFIEPEGVELPVNRDREPPLPWTTELDIRGLGDLKRRAFLEHRTQRDHLELFDAFQNALGGRELYHRVHPAWRRDATPESELLPPN